MSIKSDVIKFLIGTGPLDGCWYGERPADKGPFWWRDALEKEIESLTQQLESARNDADLHETSTEHLRVITEHWDEFGMMNSFGEKINAAKQYVKHYIDEKDRLK